MAHRRLYEFQYPELFPDEVDEDRSMTNIVRHSYYSYFKNLLLENLLNHSKGANFRNEISQYASQIELAALVKSINVDVYRSEMLKNIKTIEQFNSNEISYNEISVKEWILTNNIDTSSDSSDNEAMSNISRKKTSNAINRAANTGNFTGAGNTGDLTRAGNTGHFTGAGNTVDLTRAGNTEHFIKVENTEDSARGGNTENFARGSNTGHFATGSNTGHFARGGNTGHFARGGNTGHFARGGNSEHLARGVNTEHLTRGVNTEHLTRGGNTEHFARGGNTECVARRGNTEHVARGGNSERLARGVNTENFARGGNTRVTPMETNEVRGRSMEPLNHRTATEPTLMNNAPISNDPIYQELEKMFYNEDNNSENSPSLEVSTVMNNSKIWICEYKIYKFFFMQQMSAIYIMNPDKYDRMAERINIMFGYEDDSPQSSISLEEVVKMTKFKVAHYVRGFLSPFYKQKKLKSVEDFRILAKGIVEELINLEPRIEWMPIESGIKKTFIEKYNYIKKHSIKRSIPLFVKNIYDFHRKKIRHL